MNQKSFFNSKQNNNSFLLFKTKIPFDWRSFPQAFFPIVGLMARDSNFNIRNCSSIGNNLSIDCYYRGKPGHLYLRYNAGLDHRLVVASVQFIHRRSGYMTELFSILKQIRRAYSTGPIVIESVLSTEMEAWCKKNGFKADPVNQGNFIWPASFNVQTKLEFESLVPSDIINPDKEKVLCFMRHGIIRAAAPGIAKNYLTGESIPVEICGYERCGYYWTSVDIWHFETYNFPLPAEFLRIAKDHYLDHLKEKKQKI